MKNGKPALKPVSVAPAKPPVKSPHRSPAKSVPAPPAPDRSKISDAAKVRLELYAPQAREVFVAGSFNDWQPATTALQLCEAGRWARELSLAPGKYEYLFLVDGQWLTDPKSKDYIQNPFGGLNSLLHIS